MEIRHDTGRFYTRTKGGDAELRYDIVGGAMSIYHTFVPESERGKGVAEALANAAFEFAKASKMKVKPQCTYIVHYLEKHPEMKKYC